MRSRYSMLLLGLLMLGVGACKKDSNSSSGGGSGPAPVAEPTPDPGSTPPPPPPANGNEFFLYSNAGFATGMTEFNEGVTSLTELTTGDGSVYKRADSPPGGAWGLTFDPDVTLAKQDATASGTDISGYTRLRFEISVQDPLQEGTQIICHLGDGTTKDSLVLDTSVLFNGTRNPVWQDVNIPLSSFDFDKSKLVVIGFQVNQSGSNQVYGVRKVRFVK
jgi:hypothetical protein